MLIELGLQGSLGFDRSRGLSLTVDFDEMSRRSLTVDFEEMGCRSLIELAEAAVVNQRPVDLVPPARKRVVFAAAADVADRGRLD